MIPFISAFTGLIAVLCPHCERPQMRSRRERHYACKDCGRGFSKDRGREALRAAKARARRRS